MIYVDNAATSFPKPECVYRAIEECMRYYCANPGRGGHYYARLSSKIVMKARDALSRLFNIDDPMRICITKNATEGLNISIKGLLKPGDHVIISSMEHNAVTRPVKTLEKEIGIKVTIIKGNDRGEIDPEDFRKSIAVNTKLIICTSASNVNGLIMPIEQIGEIARECEIPFLVDASQGAGYIDIDVEKMHIDMMALPGHKGLYGPQGTGALYIKKGLNINTLMQGGTGSNSEEVYQPGIMPDMFESGTLNTPGIAGLAAGIRFIESYGLANIRTKKYSLVKRLTDALSDIEGVKLYNPYEMDANCGIVAFNIEGIDSAELSSILDRDFSIAARGGLHCAPFAHKTLGTLNSGILRISPGCFNTTQDMDEIADAVKTVCRKLHFM